MKKCPQCYKLSPDDSTECEYCSVSFVRIALTARPTPDDDSATMELTREYLAQHGLDKSPDESREDWLERLRQFRRTRSRMIGKNPQRIREPGDDDEDPALADWTALHGYGPNTREPAR